MDYIKELDAALNFIEANLDGDLHLDLISAQVNISPYHFHRIFKAVIHETVMEYVRSRRLSEAWREICRTDHRIIDVAVKYQFETQQSFTRAFKSYFGVTPGMARKKRTIGKAGGRSAFSVKVLEHIRDKDRTAPNIVTLPYIKLVGVQKFIDLKTNLEESLAPKAWSELREKAHQIENQKNQARYGVQRYPDDFDPLNNIFEYIAAVEVETFKSIPEGLIGFELPERHYVVYTYKGEVSPETMTQLYANIYGQWIFNLPYEMYCDFDFEFYGENYNPGQPDSFMSIYIPIKYQEV